MWIVLTSRVTPKVWGFTNTFPREEIYRVDAEPFESNNRLGRPIPTGESTELVAKDAGLWIYIQYLYEPILQRLLSVRLTFIDFGASDK